VLAQLGTVVGIASFFDFCSGTLCYSTRATFFLF